jgi:hypothetical protein
VCFVNFGNGNVMLGDEADTLQVWCVHEQRELTPPR